MKAAIAGLCFFFIAATASAQCSICTKSAAQLGEKPATSLNSGIIYLAAAPLTILGLLGFRWFRKNGDSF